MGDPGHIGIGAARFELLNTGSIEIPRLNIGGSALNKRTGFFGGAIHEENDIGLLVGYA